MDFRRYVREHLPPLAVSRESDIVDELAQHLSDLYQEGLAAGLGHDEALARAAAALAEPERVAQELRRASGAGATARVERTEPSWNDPRRPSAGWWCALADLRRDLAYAVRTLGRTPGFTAVALSVLAVGIGGNVAGFSLANALFFRALDVSHPDTLVRVYSSRYSNTPYRSYLEYRDRNTTLTALAAFQMQSFGVRVDDDTEHTFGTIVSGAYFPVLGIAPFRGRLLTPADDRAGAAPVVVLSHAFWRDRFGASPDVIGRTIALNDQLFTVVGVAPPGFTGVMAPLVGSVWVPLSADALLRPALDTAERLDTTSLHLIGRLEPDARLESAQAELDTIGRQLRRARGEPDSGPAVTVYRGTVLHPEISGPVAAFTAVLMTVLGLVLLIICVNVSNLVLARAAGREAELAIRQALGADRGRLIRQLLTENLVLALAGAAGGLAIAFWCTRLLGAANLPTPFPIALDVSIDARILTFTIAAAIATTLAFGAMPALQVSKVDLVRAVKDLGGQGLRHARLRSMFLVAQMALSVVLLITAGLFIRSFRHARSVDPGFDAEPVLTASLDLETRGYSPARGRDFIRTLRERLEAAPGIDSVNVLEMVPLTLSNTTMYVLRDGDAEPAAGRRPAMPEVYGNAVGPGHFQTLRIPLVAGRDFSELDDSSAPPVAIVNDTLARRFWPGQDPVGQHLRILGTPADSRNVIRIVGVARDSKYVTVGEEPRPFMYRPLAQAYTPRVTVLIRSAAAPASILPAVKQNVRALDPGLAVFNVAPLTDVIAVSLLPARVAGGLLGALGALALVLVALGIFGVLSFAVRSRTREIGVRVAMGATRLSIITMVLRWAMLWTVLGGAIGLAAATAVTGLLKGFLYGISPMDLGTFASVLVVIVSVACVAALAPAVRASRLDPLVALRSL
jgi:putative ABC transport system permease protein